MPSPGLRFGRYELIERLGAGGMGEVFRARDHDLNRDVAIKFLSGRFVSDPGHLARFTAEARAASSLNHPNIVTVHEIGETDGAPYMVIEYVDGQTLRGVLQRGRPPVRRALDIAAQIAEGLAKAHAAGIVHRDLKPENIMLTGDGVVKILDFGIAKEMPAPAGGTASAEQTETRTAAPQTAAGVVVGSIGYIAPEQARGEPTDHRADQFAFGAILYEMASGRRAFHGASLVDTLVDVIEHEPPPLSTLAPQFPPPACWIVERCLAKDRADRYASTLDLAHELRSVRDHLGDVTTENTARRESTAPKRRRVRAWQIALSALLVVSGVWVGPTIWERVTAPLAATRLPRDLRLAVLPIAVTGEASDVSKGLLEYVVVRLADLGRVHSRVSVVPASEVLDAGVKTPSAAGKALGATLAVGIAVARTGGEVRVNVSLSDPRQVLGGTSKTFAAAEFSPERVVADVVALLEVQLAASDRNRFDRGGTSVASAGLLFAQGLRETPYQQARTAAEQYDQEQSLRRAISLFNDAIDKDPRYAAAFAGLGDAHLRMYRLTRRAGDLALAEQALGKARELDDTRPALWISLGMLLVAKGNQVEAEKAFSEAIARDPNGGDAHRELGLAYQRSGQAQKAEAEYRTAIALQPESWANHNYLGAFLSGAGRTADAEKEFQTALTKAPDNVRVLSNLGALYVATKRWDEAELTLRQAVNANDRYGPALSNLGALEVYGRRNYAAAATWFERAVDLAPRDYRIWYNLGFARFWGGQKGTRANAAYRQAAALLEEEIAVNSGNPETLMRLADCHAMLGNAAKARALVAEARTHKPGREDLRVAAGVYERLGERVKALEMVRAALEAGLAPAAIETSPSLDELRADRRYAAISKASREKP